MLNKMASDVIDNIFDLILVSIFN